MTLEITVNNKILQQAQESAYLCDGSGMIQALFNSRILEAYRNSFIARYQEIDPEDIYDAIGLSMDELFDRVSKGEKIRAIKTYLWKLIDRRLIETDIKRKRFEPLDKEHYDMKNPNLISEAAKEERDKHRNKIFSTAESLIPRLGQVNVQEVMRYLLGAIKNGVQDLTSNEIGDALGLTAVNVRVSMKRGLERLARIFKEEKLIDQSDEFAFFENMGDSLMADMNDSSDNNE